MTERIFYRQFITNVFREKVLAHADIMQAMGDASYCDFFRDTVSYTKVAHGSTHTQKKRATGADGISAQMLKATGTSIVKSITKLFNLSLKTSIFPTDWKFARVVPTPKTGNPESPSNYRPISIISKLLEKHIYI